MSELGENKLISRDGWPDSYQERNAFKPHCSGATSSGGIVVRYHQALRGAAAITLSHLRNGNGYKEPALVEGIRGQQRTD